MAPAGKVVACHRLPCRQQLHLHGGEHGLLRLPPSGLQSTTNARGAYRITSLRASDLSLRDLPRHGALVDWQIRSQHHGLAVAGCARNHALRFVHMGANPFGLTAANTDAMAAIRRLAEYANPRRASAESHRRAFSTTCISCHTTWSHGLAGGDPIVSSAHWFRIPHHGSVCSDCTLRFRRNYATSLASCAIRSECSPAGHVAPECERR